MRTKTLTLMQRKILSAMAADEFGVAAFIGEGSRKHGFSIRPAQHGGIIVRAYGIPEHFLSARGLIERCERNAAGTWFRITLDGRTAVAP